MEVCLQYHTRGQQGIQDQTGGQGPRGFAGSKGEKGEKGERAVSGLTGPPGPTTGGVVYTRWGRASCPHTSGAELYCILEGQLEVILKKVVELQGGSLGSYNFPFILSTNEIRANWIANSLALLARAITGNP